MSRIHVAGVKNTFSHNLDIRGIFTFNSSINYGSFINIHHLVASHCNKTDFMGTRTKITCISTPIDRQFFRIGKQMQGLVMVTKFDNELAGTRQGELDCIVFHCGDNAKLCRTYVAFRDFFW